MKRRSKIHYGDTYGEYVWTACGYYLTREDARRQLSALIHGVTCEKCRRLGAKERRVG
jgi:hypothetical protein